MERGRPHLLFFVSALVAAVSPVAGCAMAIAGLFLFGIPHGGFDFALIEKNSVPRFLLIYLGLIGAFCILAFVSPLLAFTLFMILSAHHFGAELGAPRGFAIVAGAALFAIVFWGHPTNTSELMRFFMGSSKSHLPTLADTRIEWLTAVLLAAIIGVWKRSWLELLGLGYALWALPPLVGFSLFFVYWHSFDSFEEQRKRLGLTLTQAWKTTALLAGLAGVWLVGGLFIAPAVMFTLAGAISVAHILTRPLVDQAGVLYPSARERAAAIQ